LQATATTKTLIGLVVGVSGVSSESGTGFARWFAQYRWTGSVQIQGRFVDPHGGGFLTLPPTDVPVSHFVLGVALGIRP
jgi:hypothetical protein